MFSHRPFAFGVLFLFFLGYCEAYKRHQSKLMFREGLMVAFFLAGLVVIGGMQTWWLQPLLAGMDANTLFVGATLLTAIVDNAALTYLGSLVDGITDELKYSLVAGAVTGGGLYRYCQCAQPRRIRTLATHSKRARSALSGLVAAATIPTLIAAAAFMLPTRLNVVERMSMGRDGTNAPHDRDPDHRDGRARPLKVLAAVDGSERTGRVLEFLLSMAALPITVVVLNVQPAPEDWRLRGYLSFKADEVFDRLVHDLGEPIVKGVGRRLAATLRSRTARS